MTLWVVFSLAILALLLIWDRIYGVHDELTKTRRDLRRELEYVKTENARLRQYTNKLKCEPVEVKAERSLSQADTVKTIVADDAREALSTKRNGDAKRDNLTGVVADQGLSGGQQ